MAKDKYDITDKDGKKISKKGDLDITLDEPTGTMFKRKALKWSGDKKDVEVEWLVIKVDDVYVFIRDNDVIITKQNIRP